MNKYLAVSGIICLLYFSAGQLHAQETEIKDTISSLNFYIFQLDSKNLNIRNKTIINSIPQVIYTNVKHINRKTLSSEEISGIQNFLFNRKKKEYEKKLLELYNKRNNDFFNDIKNTAYDEEAEKYRKFSVQDPAEIEISPVKDLAIFKNEESNAIIIRGNQKLGSDDLDLYFHGSVEEIEGYLLLNIAISSRFTDGDLYTYSDAGTADQIMENLKGQISLIKETVYGEPFSELDIVASPENTRIFLDDEQIGTSTVHNFIISPGSHDLYLENDYTNPKDIEITAEPMQTVTINEKLEITDTTGSLLQTVPNGADVYLKGVWRGITPLFMENQEIGTHVVFDHDGYRESIVTGSFSNPVILKKIIPDAAFTKERELFYDSLAMFTISVIYSYFTYTYFSETQSKYSLDASLSQSEKNELLNDAWYYLLNTWGGAAVSALLFIDMTEHIISSVKR